MKMNLFMLLFRQPDHDHSRTSPSEMQALVMRWQNWVGGIAAQGRLTDNGPRLLPEGKVLRADGAVLDGPFAGTDGALGSFIVVKAGSLEEAAVLAQGCPVLDAGGSVEVRPVI
jgi:hypothetical protein